MLANKGEAARIADFMAASPPGCASSIGESDPCCITVTVGSEAIKLEHVDAIAGIVATDTAWSRANDSLARCATDGNASMGAKVSDDSPPGFYILRAIATFEGSMRDESPGRTSLWANDPLASCSHPLRSRLKRWHVPDV